MEVGGTSLTAFVMARVHALLERHAYGPEVCGASVCAASCASTGPVMLRNSVQSSTTLPAARIRLRFSQGSASSGLHRVFKPFGPLDVLKGPDGKVAGSFQEQQTVRGRHFGAMEAALEQTAGAFASSEVLPDLHEGRFQLRQLPTLC